MPELPEVETIARALRPELVGRKIVSASLLWARTLAAPSPAEFEERIVGQSIVEVGRRAKYINLQLTAFNLFIHLRMSGDLYIQDGADPSIGSYRPDVLLGGQALPDKHDRLRLGLSDGRLLIFNDTRKFGRVWLVADADEVTGGLGPEPFDPSFTAQLLYDNLHQRHRQVKPLLLDQRFLAGLGNIYTDEVLHFSGLHPLRLSDTISAPEAEKLFHAIRTVLQSGIDHNGASFDWVYRGGSFQNYFRVYNRTGQPCPVCGTLIRRMVVGQRGTHFCPTCQVM
jgi:formamidopyrimidine-DNA glycosylase